MIFGSYHRGGFNESLMEQVLGFTQGGQREFIMFGDFNAEAKVIDEGPWLSALGAQRLE